MSVIGESRVTGGNGRGAIRLKRVDMVRMRSEERRVGKVITFILPFQRKDKPWRKRTLSDLNSVREVFKTIFRLAVAKAAA
jgi:hypothetical protein